ncbi:uncharacterized protein LOC131608941 isoform X2 [Vicia villosa]|uniref:uncharacterized protein LOC131608941 isoform X2 n=1 Tax=Vicia villosa TaxID=3911 RepID=UPI00273C756E|nr:uncharacterized protein LOC131608941 isoform X2 [Vicia villosa]
MAFLINQLEFCFKGLRSNHRFSIFDRFKEVGDTRPSSMDRVTTCDSRSHVVLEDFYFNMTEANSRSGKLTIVVSCNDVQQIRKSEALFVDANTKN